MSATTLEQFRETYPARRNTRTGKWGWRRVGDCLDLRACRFDTAEEAEADRDANIRRGRIDPESGQPC